MTQLLENFFVLHRFRCHVCEKRGSATLLLAN